MEAKEKERIEKLDNESELSAGDYILESPIHDTGNLWYAVISFFLPLIGLIAGLIFKKHNYIRNYKMCLKGALVGIGLVLAAIVIFAILLLLSLL